MNMSEGILRLKEYFERVMTERFLRKWLKVK